MTNPARETETKETPDRTDMPSGSRLGIIALCTLLMAAAVYIIGTSWQAGQQTANLSGAPSSDSPSLPVAAEGFNRSVPPPLTYLETADKPNAARDLFEMQTLRAYPGAPPAIPHPADEAQQFGGNACLQCHATGGYVPQFEAYTPRVPHPELIDCRQCHVAIKSSDLFVESDWQSISPPNIHQTALVGSPPVIPHDLQLRENCLACHAGPGAAREIRVSHPERVNCLQCHVLSQTSEAWSR